MATREVTYYRAVCDCCGEEYEGDEFTAYADAEDAIDDALVGDEWKETKEGELLCSSCWIDAEDMEGYDGELNNDYVPMRRHAIHGGPDLAFHCQAIHPETGEMCTVVGEHEIHSASIENGPDWRSADAQMEPTQA